MATISKKYGTRYGRTIRKKYDNIQSQLKSKKKCPYCNKIGSVKRVATGIWKCDRCKIKFAGKAYNI